MDRAFLLWQIRDLIRQLLWRQVTWENWYGWTVDEPWNHAEVTIR